MLSDTLKLAIDERGVASLTLNRPDKRNALSADMIERLTAAAEQLAGASNVRAVLLAGAGKVFCAGADLDWMVAQMQASRAQRIAEARKLAMMLKALNDLPKPLIGRVHGGAFGGGVGLVSVCDDVIAEEATKFGLTETRLGLIPATISPYVMARIGEGMARRVFMSGRIFDAAEACRLGLVADSVPAETLDAAIETQIAPYFAASTDAVAAAKGLVRHLGARIDDEVIAETIERLADCWESDDAAERIARFLDGKSDR